MGVLSSLYHPGIAGVPYTPPDMCACLRRPLVMPWRALQPLLPLSCQHVSCLQLVTVFVVVMRCGWVLHVVHSNCIMLLRAGAWVGLLRLLHDACHALFISSVLWAVQGDCSEADPYVDYEGSLRCMMEGSGVCVRADWCMLD